MKFPAFFKALSGCVVSAVLAPLLIGEEGLQVASLNLAKETRAERILADLASAPRVRDADVLLLQEVLDAPDTRVARELAKALGRHYAFAPAFIVHPGVWEGLAILSRRPLRDREIINLKPCNLHIKTRSRIALGYTVDSALGPVRIFNLHLDNRINEADKRAQVSSVIERATRYRQPVLIGGDFNTSDFLWLGHLIPLPYLQRQREVVRQEMEAKGFSTPFLSTPGTFHLLGFKLDWIFLKRLRAVAQGVEAIPFSDHRAIWAELVSAQQAAD